MTKRCANCKHYRKEDAGGGQCDNPASTFARVGKDWLCGWWKGAS